jgi:hypothetical protein
VSGEPTRLRAVRPDLGEALDSCIARALAKDVNDRWPSAEHFRRALLDAWGDPGADVADVAAFVKSETAPTLDERGRHVAHILEERGAPTERASVPLTSTITAPTTRWRKRRVVVGVVVGVFAVGALAWGLHAAGARARRVDLAPSLPALTSSPPVASALPIEPVPPPPESATPAAPRTMVQLLANAPVARLQVAGRSVVPIAPSKEISVPLGPVEAKRTLHVVAVASDGRRAVLDLPAEASSATIRFGPSPGPKPHASGPAPTAPAPVLLPDSLGTP